VGVGAAVAALLSLSGVEPAVAAPPVHPAGTPAAKPARMAERPDRVSALLTARVQGSRVEIDSERTESSTTYANPDGTLTTEQATGPVRFRDGTGAWRDIDVTLAQAPDGSVRAVSFPGGLTFAGPGGTPGRAGQVRDLARIGSGAGAVTLRWPGALPRPVVAGTRVTYRDVLPATDLVLEATRSGFEQFLVLRSRPKDPAALALRLPLVLGGRSVRATAGGGAEVLDRAGRPAGALAAPVMWDASVDPRSGEHRHRTAVPMTTRAAGGAVELGLAPRAAFLSDPHTVYPVTIDPSYTGTVRPSFDTFVESDFSSDQSASTELRVGTFDGGTSVARSLFNLNLSAYAGRQIQSATLQLWEFHSWSCTAAQWNVYSAGVSSTATRWTAQPAWGALWATSTQTRGHDSGCAAGWVTADVSDMIQAWANQNAGAVGLGLRAASETDNFGWKKFNSGNAGSNIPTISITYDSYPAAAGARSTVPATSCVIGANRPYVNTRTPQLKAAVSDPDGGNVAAQVDVWPTGGSGPIWTGTSGGVTSGSVAGVTVPGGKLAEGANYSWRVRGSDGTLVSKAWSTWCEFTTDTVKPATPTVTSTAYPAGGWNTTGGAGAFAVSSSDPVPAGGTAAGVGTWRWWLDSGTPTAVAGGASSTLTITPPNGWHTLHVQAVDKAGNVSAETTYAFGAVAGVTSPTAEQVTQSAVTLGAVGPPAATAVRFQYQLPGTTTWTDIPTADVRLAGAAVAAWPVSTVVGATAANAPANLVWSTAATLSNVDGPVTVRAVLTGGASSWTTDTHSIILDQKAFGGSYATESVGPGSVSLLTGNYSVAESDVQIAAWGSDLTISRTFNSFSAATPGVFGPGWTTSLAVEATDSDWTGLKDTGSAVIATDVDGGLTVFAKAGAGWVATGDAAGSGLTLAKSAAPDEYTIADLDGESSTFAFASGPATATPTAPRLYRMARVTQPGSNQVTTYGYNADGTPAQILAPVPTGATCSATTWSPGCRALQLAYTAGKISKVTIKTTDGAGAVKTVDAACYSYDANGRLAAEWDPTVNGTTCGTPVLPTSYGYDGSGRLSTVTPPGQAAWVMSYDAQGRFDHVDRTHNAANGGGTETSTVRYGMPFGAAAGTDETHPDLSAAAVATWAQADLPVTATAVFGPGDTVSTSDLRDAAVHALDVNGREVDTASFSGTGQAGWKVSTTEYDQFGNTVRQLSAADRELALTGDPAALGLPAGTGTAEFAEALDSRSIYAADGVDLIDTYGPLHNVAIDGAWVYARAHTHNTYGTLDTPGTDPTVDGPKHAVTVSTEAASLSPDTTPTDEADVRTTRTAYGLPGDATGWTLKQAMRTTTVVPGGADVVKETVYNAATGLPTQSRAPSAAGSATSVGTTTTTYYAAGTRNDAGCVNSAWVNLVCKTGPAAQPTTAGLARLPVTWSTYDWLGRATTATETVVDAAGATQTRTSTTEYENAGFSQRVHRALTTGTVGVAVPAVTTSYDTATGQPTAVGTDTAPAPAAGMAGSTSTAYDDFGRVTSYTDADGAMTLTAYTPEGRTGTITTKALGGAVLGTTTFGYNAGTEHRGLTTSVTDSGVSGAITGAYDADGSLAVQSFPGGLTQTTTRDTTADATRLVWAKNGVTWVDDSQSSSIHGQQRWHTGPDSWQLYGYDGASRLVAVWDQQAGQGCVARGYQYDVDTNRTGEDSWAAGDDGSCPPNTAATHTTHSYDAADRLLPQNGDTGLAYDAFGRTTTLPAALAGGTDATMSYYVTDMVAGQTQGAATRSWTLDPGARLRAAAASGAPTRTNHYDDASSDSPAWVDENTGTGTLTATRYLGGLDGNLAAAVTCGATTGARWQLTNLHGDVITTAADDPALSTPDGPMMGADEFGNPRAGAAAARYGWLGGKQRSTDALGGLVLMGVRLYDPALGRFLQTDPVPGGSCSDYDYSCADPVNGLDLDGKRCWSLRCAGRWAMKHKWDIIGAAATFVPLAGEAAWAYRGYRAYRMARGAGWLARGARFGRAVSPFHGLEFRFASGFRFKPFGFWRGSRLVMRLPHYHSRRLHAPSGRSGVRWHRPWETTFRRWF
jgi:RHS repeat-associated protein